MMITTKIITQIQEILKGIELKPEINNKAVGEIAVIPSSTTSTTLTNKKISEMNSDISQEEP